MRQDKVTQKISELLEKIPYCGASLAKLYNWNFMMFNTMIVGATGTLLSYGLYEGMFRPALSVFFGGAFLAMVITTIVVFVWNFEFNKAWGLNFRAQIQKLKENELKEARYLIEERLGAK